MRRLSLILITLPLAAVAQESSGYQCTSGDLTRHVEIVYETGASVPCEVQYYKDNEAPGDVQVLWRAMNEEGYCDTRASEFVTKLKGMGWDCTASAAAEPAEEAVEPDDTDDLAPAAEIELTEAEVQNL